jgi:hypothetical protein
MDDSRKVIKDNMIEENVSLQEIGGIKGLEPTRYGEKQSPEWEVKGRVSDF